MKDPLLGTKRGFNHTLHESREPIMAMLSSKSSRFTRSFNYTMPEYRNPRPQAHKSRISVVVPATHERAPQSKANRTDSRG